MIIEQNIGGEFEIYPNDFLMNSKDSAWPIFKNKKSVRCNSGRSALVIAINDWKKSHKDFRSIWLPDFLCHSIYNTINNLGFDVFWYHNKPGDKQFVGNITPKKDDLFLYINYFGWPNTAVNDWLDLNKKRSWGVIEDCVQSPYTKDLGLVGDYLITSLRKWWPSPDGAQVHYKNFIEKQHLYDSDEVFISQRLIGKVNRGEKTNEKYYLDLFSKSEQRLDVNLPRKCSYLSERLLSCVNISKACKKRQQNWKVLQEGLELIPNVKMIYSSINNKIIPLVAPIIVSKDSRDELRTFLLNHNIFCPIHWTGMDYWSNESLDMSQRILSLPLDQRYGNEQMNSIIKIIQSFYMDKKYE